MPWIREKNIFIPEYTDTPSNKCPGYDINPSDCDTPVLEIWEMWHTP